MILGPCTWYACCRGRWGVQLLRKVVLRRVAMAKPPIKLVLFTASCHLRFGSFWGPHMWACANVSVCRAALVLWDKVLRWMATGGSLRTAHSARFAQARIWGDDVGLTRACPAQLLWNVVLCRVATAELSPGPKRKLREEDAERRIDVEAQCSTQSIAMPTRR